ncbi:MAG: hypothetical protein M0D54_02405 [Hyphomonadaceae bacterium JAD_PAG50586_4]|nr:MAG: hypothetical protein M0D54_02405 [Hyphomonadaceae bacterium JAD_PAG50586_4]
MKADHNVPALFAEALYSKSRVYIQRALARKDANDLDEYQLWASLALELLGKAALSRVHPCLIADPTHYQSMFAAAGVPTSTDIKTITAKTLFERLGHLSAPFDESVRNFCNAIAQRRNAELHSGDAPFKVMKLGAWEAAYWHACDLIVKYSGSTLEEWLGADQAKAPQTLLKHATEALKDAVEERISKAKTVFLARKKADQVSALAEAEGKEAFHYTKLFATDGDATWAVACPACSGRAHISGFEVYEEITQDGDGEYEFWESVEKTFSPKEFRCPVCALALNGYAEMKAAKLDADHVTTEEREMVYEPDYGNC